MDIPKEELLHLLIKRGYKISIINKDSDTQMAIFNHSTAKAPYIVTRIYSNEFMHYEIKLDCVYDLLRWSGLRVIYTLDY